MRIVGVIIAGGQSSRMGREKSFVELGGQPLLSHVLRRLAPQVEAVAINANGDPDRFARFNLPVFADRISGIATPLVGIHAALAWAQEAGYGEIVTVTSDAPFIPRDLVARLRDGGRLHAAAVAASGGQAHFATGLWPVGLRHDLAHFLVELKKRRAADWIARIAAAAVEWSDRPYDPFFNINTPDDLVRAVEIAAISD